MGADEETRRQRRWPWVAAAAVVLIFAAAATAPTGGACFDPPPGGTGYCVSVDPAAVVRLAVLGIAVLAAAGYLLQRAFGRRRSRAGPSTEAIAGCNDRMRDHVLVSARGDGRVEVRAGATSPTPQPWAAPLATRPVRATVTVPGSKSLTNRALILAAQADAPSLIVGPLRSRDTDLMAAGLRALGVEIAATPSGDWIVTPRPLRGPARIDCGLAGTVMRFLPPLAATATGRITVDGDDAARRRPMRPALDALRSLGAAITGDALPFEIEAAGRVPGGTVIIDASASSQFVSGLLLAAPSFENGVTVIHRGPPLPSLPHIEMTVQCLRKVGVPVDDSVQAGSGQAGQAGQAGPEQVGQTGTGQAGHRGQAYHSGQVDGAEPNAWHVPPGPVLPWRERIEPDLSNATVFLAAAAVTGGTVTVLGWPSVTTQAGDAFRDIAAAMGCIVRQGVDGLTLTGPKSLRGIDIDMRRIGELTPTVAAMALLADGPSQLRGIGHLRGHETDRIAALQHNITALGGAVTADAESLHITPSTLHAGTWNAFADHRMATAGAIIGLRVPGIDIDDIACTGKTLPEFPTMWAEVLSDTTTDESERDIQSSPEGSHPRQVGR